MSSYKFVTNWRFHAPLPRVWEEITQSERWPEWWKAVASVVELKAGDADGVGSIRRYTWRGALPYQLRFDMTTTRVDKHFQLAGEATGELTGRGLWTFAGVEGATHVRYDWEVDVTKAWMRILSPVARPLFEWNHDVVMNWGFEGLSSRLR